jgi:competence/damage-inducible protein CinA-like protein
LWSNYQSMENVFASIITIGDELLIGQTIDTNSAWMAQELNKAGVWVRRRVATGDVWDDIWNALDEESKNADIIFITGGLGPTTDDITKPLLCKYFNGKMIMNEEVLKHVKEIFEKLKRPLLENNMKQAEVPDVCTVLPNKNGTAPGMLFKKDKKIYISLPGVPHEMKDIMHYSVLPMLPQLFTMPVIVHLNALTAGQGESFIAETLSGFEKSLPAHIKLAYLPGYGMVRLRLTGTGSNREGLEKEVEEHFEKMKGLVKKYLVTDTDESLEKVIGNLLKERHKFVASAESCTGGLIAMLLTMHPGSSNSFKGGIVAYANQAKENVLGVKHKTLVSVGAVSEETVQEMVKGVLERLKADYAVATSGIMGPDGGTPYKPVGTVWIAVGNNNKIEAKQFYFRFDRKRNTELSAYAALNMLRLFILSDVE